MSNESIQLEKFSFLHGKNSTYIDELYEEYKKNPESVDESWRYFFKGYEFSGGGKELKSNDMAKLESKVESYINYMRKMGHMSAHLNPLAKKPELEDDLLPKSHDLGFIPSGTLFYPANLPYKDSLDFNEILEILKDTYCSTIGADFRDITSISALTWFQESMEPCRNKPDLSSVEKRQILSSLVKAEGFEQFLQDRYIGQKRFSIEGLESLLPLLDTIANDCANSGLEEICIGMAHRGRLNVLANFLGKPYEMILKEFEDSEIQRFDIDGDVKYHMGFSNYINTPDGKKIRVYLSPNPSHLEAVDPVVEGFTRARQRLYNDEKSFKKIIPVLIHGDASFIGQGLVAETLNLSNLESYKTGGTIHIITNNQVGYTTNPDESRSCLYSSDIAKLVRAPVLHVNADDPEAVVWTAKLAVEYRNKYNADIVIDLIGYRRHGHNEGDEPSFTQPLSYKIIKQHPTVLKQYGNKLAEENIVSSTNLDQEKRSFRNLLQECQNTVKSGKINAESKVPPELLDSVVFPRSSEDDLFKPVNTKISEKNLKKIAREVSSFPEGFVSHPKLKRLFKNRLNMVEGEGSIDWGLSELITFGNLASEGTYVRLSGQDCKRGTFSHRHSVIFNYETGEPLELLNQISDAKEKVDVINSPLSEQGVLGFEFGYSVANPKALVLWEAQFGDFCNGGQIIIDQFLAASEAKWRQCSGLVLLLPHGHEGAGPEHSSARPERFLQLCGNNNMQIANLTTPAQFYHIMMRQMRRSFKKPLIIMTPKGLLRLPEARSKITDYTNGEFQEVVDDQICKKPEKIDRILFCTGKIYYDLNKERLGRPEQTENIAIVRIEQLYPFPDKKIEEMCKKYSNVKEFLWVQEEPSNMGAWTFIRHRLKRTVLALTKKSTFWYLGRKGAGTTAEGSRFVHLKEQERIILEALNLGCSMDQKQKI